MGGVERRAAVEGSRGSGAEEAEAGLRHVRGGAGSTDFTAETRRTRRRVGADTRFSVFREDGSGVLGLVLHTVPKHEFSCHPVQSLAVKRAEVEFHRFASLGEPERALRVYGEENVRRASFLARTPGFCRAHVAVPGNRRQCGPHQLHAGERVRVPGLRAGYFRRCAALRRRTAARVETRARSGAGGGRCRDAALPRRFAADGLRLPDAEPVPGHRGAVPGSEAGARARRHLPVRGGTGAAPPHAAALPLPLPGDHEALGTRPAPLGAAGLPGARRDRGRTRRRASASARTTACTCANWQRLMERHFAAHQYQLFVPERGWAERWPKRALPDATAAELLGGTIAAVCRKAGKRRSRTGNRRPRRNDSCAARTATARSSRAGQVSHPAACAAAAPRRTARGVQPAPLRPLPHAVPRQPRRYGADFSQPGHEARLSGDWYEVEGVFGNKYRWMGPRAAVRLRRVEPRPPSVCASAASRTRRRFPRGEPVTIAVAVNGAATRFWKLDRPGLFILEGRPGRQRRLRGGNQRHAGVDGARRRAGVHGELQPGAAGAGGGRRGSRDGGALPPDAKRPQSGMRHASGVRHSSGLRRL